MWYRIGRFEPDTESRAAGTHRVGRWCIISGPHYRRYGSDKRKDLAEELAATLARTASYELESVITVSEHELGLYNLCAFPWLLIQSTFWGRREK